MNRYFILLYSIFEEERVFVASTVWVLYIIRYLLLKYRLIFL